MSEFGTIHGTTKGKPIGYMRIKDREYRLVESHVASLSERIHMYQLLMSVAKEAQNDDRPNWLRLRLMLWWGVILKPNSKACSYERIWPDAGEQQGAGGTEPTPPGP